jgi:hypothetical protein
MRFELPNPPRWGNTHDSPVSSSPFKATVRVEMGALSAALNGWEPWTNSEVI